MRDKFSLVYLKTLLVVLVLDSLYLSIIGKSFGRLVQSVQGSKLKLNFVGAGLCYLLLAFVISYFVVFKKLSKVDSLLLGSSVYGVFDLTNLAIFKKWDPVLSVIDIVWGGLLFLLSRYIVQV